MEPFSLSWAASMLTATLFGSSPDATDHPITGVCTDSRKIQPGDLFFALIGENSDGHQYVAQALAKGAAAAVVSRKIENAGGIQMIVPDSLAAFGDLARAYRRQFHIPVVGITGSVGKTSTREMIAAVLRTKYNTLSSEKNYNNEIGVPLTLFQLTRQHEAAVIEMGMRGPGEIDRLAEIAEPTVGVITNIGYAHIERLGSREAIAQAKSELLARLPVGDGIAVLPEHDVFYQALRNRVPAGCEVFTFSDTNRDADIQIIEESQGQNTIEYEIRFNEQVHRGVLNTPVSHSLRNAACAIAVGVVLTVPVPLAIEALARWQGAEGRMEIRNTRFGTTVLDDCYNAGPESMDSALTTLAKMGDGRKVAVLGSIKEIGDYALELHWKVGLCAARTAPRLLITVGDEAEIIAATAREALGPARVNEVKMVHFSDTDTAAAHIREWIQPGDTVLVKGSRAMEMEKIVVTLTGEGGVSAHG